MKQIGTTQVLDEMYNRAMAVRAKGGKAFATAPGLIVEDGLRGEFCANCTGTGNLILRHFVTGPKGTPLPQVQPDHNNPHRVPMTSMWYNGHWYGVKTYCFKCPVCNEILEL